MKDDRFLEELRRDPDPAFARDLRARLRDIEQDEPLRRAPRTLPVLAAAAGVAVVAVLFVSPGLRLRAQALLDLFRVREFAVVQVDEARLQMLRERKFDVGSMLVGAGRPADEAPPRPYTSLAAATAAAGFAAERPEVLPLGLAPDTVWVHGEVRKHATIDTRPLRELMDAFDVRDLQIPAGVDGGTVDIDVPAMVAQTFRSGGRSRAMLVQGASPEVSLPKGVDLARLGEIGLRIAGVGRDEARRLAGAIDWRSTLVVPVIASATTFQQVTVQGQRGLFVETSRTERPDGGSGGPGSAVLWTRNGRVYALVGNFYRVPMLQMAESVR